MPYCQYCHMEIPEGAGKCPYCHITTLPPPKSPITDEEKQRNTYLTRFFISLFASVMFMLVFLASGGMVGFLFLFAIASIFSLWYLLKMIYKHRLALLLISLFVSVMLIYFFMVSNDLLPMSLISVFPLVVAGAYFLLILFGLISRYILK